MRAFAMLLGIAYHVSIAFIPDIGRWYPIADRSPSDALRIFSDTLHSFRMELFFVLAGYFAHLLIERRGPQSYLRDRLKRLGIPLLVVAPFVILCDWAFRTYLADQHALSPAFEPGDHFLLRPLYLWFLEYLLLFSLCAYVVINLIRLINRNIHLSARPFIFPEALLLLAGPTFAIRNFLQEATPAFSFVPQVASVLHYGIFYTLGFILHAWPGSTAKFTRLRWFAPVGIVGLIAFFTRENRWSLNMYALQALLTWASVLGCLGFAFSIRTIAGRWLPFLVDASYWVYLAHYPLVLALHMALSGIDMPALLKFSLDVLIINFVCLLIFSRWVRTSFLAPWLGVRTAQVST